MLMWILTNIKDKIKLKKKNIKPEKLKVKLKKEETLVVRSPPSPPLQKSQLTPLLNLQAETQFG